jgi:hypothetical protein
MARAGEHMMVVVQLRAELEATQREDGLSPDANVELTTGLYSVSD